MSLTRLATLLLLVAGGALAAYPVAAQTPFGVAPPDPGGGGLLPWVAELQRQFYRDLTAALRGLRDSGQAVWWLASLSFLYGIVHAAGPGHGKVVISSYLLANGESARRGVLIAFLAAMVQATVAVGLVGVAAALLNLTSFAITDTARGFEIGSYALIAALGLYLVGRKGRAVGSEIASAAGRGGGPASAACCHAHVPPPPAPGRTGGAAAAILSVGIRPCAGALIVLVFALANGIFWAGVVSTYLMGLGVAITVAALAALALGARDVAARLTSGDSRRSARIMLGLEVMAALAVAAFGTMLLLGALYG